MKTNIFVLRALVAFDVTGDNTGKGFIIEQTFKTERFYDITVTPNVPSWMDGKPAWNVFEDAVIETEKGTLFTKDGLLNANSKACFATIDVGLVEDVANGTFTINPSSIRFEQDGQEVNQDIASVIEIHAAAVRVHCGDSTQDSDFNNTHFDVYLDSHDISNVWLVKQIIGGQNAGRHAFDNPRYTAHASGMAHIEGAVPEVVETSDGCCEAENNNMLILAATNLIASNNPFNSILAGKLKDVLEEGSSTESTREFLTYASNVGALANVGHIAAQHVVTNATKKDEDGNSKIRTEEVME